jgi:hypothetical protein
LGEKIDFQRNQRKLKVLEIENIMKNILPKNKDELVALISFQTGISLAKIKEILQILYINKVIKYDEDGLIAWNRKE